MEAFRARQFAKSLATPNTFIGGIAKTGGTGVNEPIDTPWKLSQKLGIAVNRITGFKVIGDDVECRIRGSYGIPLNAFGHQEDASANKNITSYYDEDNLVTGISSYAFSRTNLENIKLENVTSLGWGAFQYSKLKSGYFPNYAPTASTQSVIFYNCTNLELLNMPLLKNAPTQMIRGCSNANFQFLAPLLEQVGEFFFMQLNVNFNETDLVGYPNLHTINNRSFSNTNGFEEINIPSLTTCNGVTPFYQMNNVKRYYLNNVTTFSSSPSAIAFSLGNRACELIELKKCKTLPNLLVGELTGVTGVPNATNFTCRLHIDTEFQNAVISLKTTFPWTVIEFYDDDGDYVKTI